MEILNWKWIFIYFREHNDKYGLRKKYYWEPVLVNDQLGFTLTVWKG